MIDKQKKYALAEKYMRRIKADFPSLAWDDALCLGTLVDLIDDAEKIISFTPVLANVQSSVSCVDCGKRMLENSHDYKKLADGIVCRNCIGDRCID